MGGYGSGNPNFGVREYWYAEDCIILDIRHLRRLGLLEAAGTSLSLSIRPDRPDAHKLKLTALVDYEDLTVGGTAKQPSDRAVEFLISDIDGKLISQPLRVRLTARHTNIHGFHIYFACPQCRRAVFKLFCPPHSSAYRCRHCHELRYQKACEGESFRRLRKLHPAENTDGRCVATF